MIRRAERRKAEVAHMLAALRETRAVAASAIEVARALVEVAEAQTAMIESLQHQLRGGLVQ